MRNSGAELTVMATSIAAELHAAKIVARELSLAAKNSRAVVIRAGSRAASIKVISDFFGDLATRTINTAEAINQLAIAISNSCVSDWMTDAFMQHLISARTNAASSPHVHSLEKPLAKARESRQIQQGIYQKLVSDLDQKLDEIKQFMKAVGVVAVTSRLEATQAGEFEAVLTEMANNIHTLASRIGEHVNRARHMLDSYSGIH
jgi:hypothetical protein